MMTTCASGRLSRTCLRSERPSMPGMRTSSRMRSKGEASTSLRAAVPSLTAVTWYPAPRNPFSRTQRRLSSSSAIRIWPAIVIAVCDGRHRGDVVPSSRKHSSGAPESSGDGQIAGDGGALAGLARDLDGAAVLVDDAVAEGQAEPKSLVLGREERSEEPGAG